MKYFFTTIFLSLVLNLSHAKEVVTVYWGWGAGDSLANITRTLIHEANANQSKYLFLFDVKPGAGGAVGAEFVKRTPNTILATSSAFFVRPNLYPTSTNYKINEFEELLPQCYAPIVITSSRYKSWKEIHSNTNLLVGNAGLGSTTHLTGIQLQSKYRNLTFVPYKGVLESFTGMVAGDVDLDVGFIGSVNEWSKNKSSTQITVLGVTGSDRNLGYPLLIDQGFNEIFQSINLPLHLVVAKNTPPEKSQEWRKILTAAAKSDKVQKSYNFNYCTAFNEMTDKDIKAWFAHQEEQWKKLSKGITLEK